MNIDMNDLENINATYELKDLESHSLDKHPRPAVTVDNVIISRVHNRYALLLIERRNNPFSHCWALPGGFILEQEPPRYAAKRKLTSETNLKDIPLMPIGTFGDSNRDPRGWMITLAYCAFVDQTMLNAFAGDDAAKAKWFELNWLNKKDIISFTLKNSSNALGAKLRRITTRTSLGDDVQFELLENSGIAFDHAKIIATAIEYIQNVV